MAEPVSLSTRKVVLTGTEQTLKGNKQETTFNPLQIPNPDVKVVVTNPITPPSVIIPKTVTPVEAVNTKKPELVVDISRYFQTSYPELEERHIMLFNQKAIMTSSEFRFIVPMSWMLGKPKTVEEYNKMLKLVALRPEIREGYRYREMNGIVLHSNVPKELAQKIELLAKSFVYLYASHKDLEDYGMDMDYLTTPVIDHDSEGKEIIDLGYANYPYVSYLAQYDKLLSEYNGLSTVGKLGRELGLKGIPLYELWKELTKAGVVSNYTYKRKNDYGEEKEYTCNKWLEVSKNINVKELVASLQVTSEVKKKLENYLLSLQNGKKRDIEFANRYEKLKKNYCDKLLAQEYFLMGGLALSGLTEVDTRNKDEFFKWLSSVYLPKEEEWEKEYDVFNSDILSNLGSTIMREEEKAATHFYNKLIKRLEAEKEQFQGRIPLGQEYLFYLLKEMEDDPKDENQNGFYDVKFK